MTSRKLNPCLKRTMKNEGDHQISQCNHQINGKYIHYKPVNAKEGKKTVELYKNNGARFLIVPNREPTEPPAIWPRSEYARLKNQAHIVTQKDRLAIIEEADRKARQLQTESIARKAHLQKSKIDSRAKPGSKLSDIETEAASKNLYVLQRAFELRQEQEDEIKYANGLILATKCLAIREAQIIEKDLIDKEMKEEDCRLDKMMEQERQRLLKREEEYKEKQHKLNQQQVKAIFEQINEKATQRLLEAERKEEESRTINRAIMAMRKEEAEQIQQTKLEQHRTREEFSRFNEAIEQYRIVQKEEARIAEMRVQEFMRKKAEREAIREAEIKAAKDAKEKEIARLREQQEHAQGEQAATDELNAQRIQEEVERQWREKERAAAQKRKEDSEALIRGRQVQIDDIRRAQALEIERDEREFHEVAKVQNDLYQKDVEKKRLKREANVRHRKELLKQINDKEMERITNLKIKFQEGDTLRLEQDVRSINIKNIVKKKVHRLRENNIPEHFVRDVERQLKLP